jgi:uncharacterized repeat protein (TIGR03803 family)
LLPRALLLYHGVFQQLSDRVAKVLLDTALQQRQNYAALPSVVSLPSKEFPSMSRLLSTSFQLHKVARRAALALCSLVIIATIPAAAQTFTVLSSFGPLPNGANPYAGLTQGPGGSFYGSTLQGGSRNSGTVFRLAQANGTWVLTPLYSFTGEDGDGAFPLARPIVGADGTLYGTTSKGGDYSGERGECPSGCGVVYNLQPPSSICRTVLCSWTESLPYTFDPDSPGHGLSPLYGELLLDPSGNLFGTTSVGGTANAGTAFELTRSNNGWAESVIYNFQAGNDGAAPASGLVRDSAGNLYGTTQNGGSGGCGAVYELSNNGVGWTERVLYSFQCAADGKNPVGGVIFDQAGNLYGATPSGGTTGGGTVYELTADNWTFTLLYTFTQTGGGTFAGPIGSLVMDGSGNLYGATFSDGAYGLGAAFQLSPANGGWSYRSLHDFTLLNDGGFPAGNLILDSQGNLYGTALDGGGGACEDGCGVIYKIAP